MERRQPGQVRDAIMRYLTTHGESSVAEIHAGVVEDLGVDVPASSVRSYLNINTPRAFVRTERGRYRLKARS